jgi:hypothetical protein
MAELLLVGLAGIGYYLNKDGRVRSEKIGDNVISKNEKPSGEDVYNSRYLEKVQETELTKATDRMNKSFEPEHTGVINSTYKSRQETKYDTRDYDTKFIQKESDLKPNFGNAPTTKPSSSKSVFDTSKNLMDKDTVTKYGIQSFNDKRRRLSPLDEQFQNSMVSKDAGGEKPILSQGLSMQPRTVKNQSFEIPRISKGVKVWDKGHNNMEPFFGGSIKQNVDPHVFNTKLEKHTGSGVVFPHKKEVKRMFPTVKNPFVNGMSVSVNRQMDRFIPALHKNNQKPFEEIRVAPGLNKSMNDNSTNIGFHDPYRYTPKTANELRINPKLTYKGRITGEGFYNSKRTAEMPVISRRNVDLSYTNFAPGDGQVGGKKYRNNLATTHGGVDKGQILDQDTILLKNVERNEYAGKIENFKGGAVNASQGKHVIAEVRVSNKPTYSVGARNVSKNREGTYTYEPENWTAKSTIKQQTENNVHSHINMNDGSRKGRAYDEEHLARQTIREQTENHEHSHINNGTGYRKGQRNPYDDAKVTIKQQTLVENYRGIAGSGASTQTQTSRQNYYNAEINGLKEATIIGRAPTQQGVKQMPHRGLINQQSTNQQFSTYEHTQRTGRQGSFAPPTANRSQITQQREIYGDAQYNRDRIDPGLLNAFKSNPYTQSLSSHIVPQNQAFPTKPHST